MNERELLVDCLRRLNRSGITYYLTGSMASNYWGIPRTTHVLDFVVLAVQANALDKNYLRSWAKELEVAGDLERLLSGEIKPKST